MAHSFFRTQKSQNYTEFIRMVFCVFREFCVKHHTQEFSHTNSTEFIRMAFCVFRGFCVKHYTQELSHTDSTEIYSLHSYSTPHGARAKRLAVLCIPWILCETRNNLL